MNSTLNLNEDVNFRKESSYNIITINDEQLRGKAALILNLLISKVNEDVSFDEIMLAGWGLHDWDWFHLRSMDVYLSHIRKFLSKYSNVTIVRKPGTSLKLIDELQ